MNKAYSRNYWENRPSDQTPINKVNLNKIEAGIDEIDDRVVLMDTTKLDKATAMTMVKDVAFDESTGIFTVTYLNGATIILDTKMEKLAINFTYDKENQQLVITLDDGTKQYVDLSALITEYEFVDGDIITFTIDSNGKVSASIKDGSIPEEKLQPNFLADVKVEVAKAQSSASAAAASEQNAKVSEEAALASEEAAKASEQNAKSSEEAAADSASTATEKATAAEASATSALSYANTASSEADAAAESEANAKLSEEAAASSEKIALDKASEAATSAQESLSSAAEAESYAHGGTGTRDGEDADNAKYYYEQTKQVSQGLNGIIPQGTVAFADLPTSGMEYGWMYNISDEFTSDERFNDGGGVYYGAGNNVIWVSGDKWDVTAGSGVTGVKGAKETTYRQGNVDISPENIGALPEDGNAVSATKATQDENGNNIVNTYQTKTGNTNNNSVTFATADEESPTAWTSMELFKSGEKHSSLFSKISTMFKNVRWLYKMLGATDISAIGGGTVTGAIVSQNEALVQLNTDLQWKQLGSVAGTDVGGNNTPLALPDDYCELLIFVRPDAHVDKNPKSVYSLSILKQYIYDLDGFGLPYWILNVGHAYALYEPNQGSVGVKVSKTHISLDYASYGTDDTTTGYYMTVYYR